MRRRLTVTVSALSLLATAPAFAQSTGSHDEDGGVADRLKKVTVSATKAEQNVNEVPATVSVITGRQIEDGLVNDIKDLVRFEPGVSVRTNPSRFSAAGSSLGRDGNSGFNIRGLEGNRILIQLDGIRVPDAFSFGAQAVGRGDYVDLDLIKSVEILRGPASALYGSDGVAGAVSLVTKDPDDLLKDRDWFASAKLGYASADRNWAKGAMVAGRAGAWSTLVAYNRRDGKDLESAGDIDTADTDRTTSNPQDTAQNAVLAKLLHTPTAQHRFQLAFDHLDRRVDSTVLSAIAKPPLAATSAVGLVARDDIDRNRVSLDHRFSGGTGFLGAAHGLVYLQKAQTREYAAEDRLTAADRIRDNRFDNRVIGAQLDLESVLQTGSVYHRFIYGGDVSVTRQKGLRDGTVPPAGETFPTKAFPDTDYTLAGLFAQDEIALLDGALTFYPALRLDFYKLDPKRDPLYPLAVAVSRNDTHLSPKLGVVAKPAAWVNLFANYASGFKAPAPSQVNNGFTNTVGFYSTIPNADLKPETNDTIEGGIRLFSAPGADIQWNASATAFAGWYKNFIDQVQVAGNFTPTNPTLFQYVNRARVRISGFEARGDLSLANGFGGIAALSYARGSTRTAGVRAPLDSVDPFKLVAGVTYRDPEAARFGGQLTVTHSAGKKQSRVSNSCSPACFTPPGFTLFDATAWVDITEHATLRVGLFNLFNRKYWWWSDVRGLAASSPVTQAYTQPGRNVSASLTVRL